MGSTGPPGMIQTRAGFDDRISTGFLIILPMGEWPRNPRAASILCTRTLHPNPLSLSTALLTWDTPQTGKKMRFLEISPRNSPWWPEATIMSCST